jgi:hypothetical protein
VLDRAGWRGQAGAANIRARTRALGKDWDVRITVASIDPDKRALDLTTQLPFGITVHNHIVCGALDNQRCRVSFG